MTTTALRPRATPSGITLTVEDACIVKGMLERGDAQHFIAAWFAVNPGRIAEIATGARYSDAVAASAHTLPPPGPYLSPCQASELNHAIAMARAALELADHLLRPKAQI